MEVALSNSDDIFEFDDMVYSTLQISLWPMLSHQINRILFRHQ
jgi:hypothetical protein